ncbi:hypothetical protein Emag_006156 [Eimeria magna]
MASRFLAFLISSRSEGLNFPTTNLTTLGSAGAVRYRFRATGLDRIAARGASAGDSCCTVCCEARLCGGSTSTTSSLSVQDLVCGGDCILVAASLSCVLGG